MTDLTIEDFSGKQGDTFQMEVDDATILDVTLTEVKAEPPRDYPGRTRDPFSLYFDGTRDRRCSQRLYLLRHGSGWQGEVFLVPIGRNEDGTYRYQAVFN